MVKIFSATAALWCLTGGGVLAEDAKTGIVKPFGSVLFAPDRDVASRVGARDRGPLDRPVDMDPEGTPRMRRAVAFPHRRGAADRRSRRGDRGDDRSSADPAWARRVCRDGNSHGAPIRVPGNGRVRDVRHLRSGLRHQMGKGR